MIMSEQLQMETRNLCLAEKALLGSFLKENHLLHDTIIRPEHFAEGRHRLLMQLMKKIHSKSRAIDSITLALEDDPERYGGLSYVQELLSYANPVRFEDYEDIVLEQWKEREKRNILTLAVKKIGRLIEWSPLYRRWIK